eukprot:CAMPEP_0116914444 /NCGR_PEP_ID=MMETSP0467-20121206/17332_1 /TAXON_ID=283647 /ORGANISM="Mesodinium pulex, Strain SPMC105" /LENGTH=126 /DNA_ID=CAMNT_0004590909 /DNA_START=710 /DNA_END=1090 /DNA_ORIENTATION=+
MERRKLKDDLTLNSLMNKERSKRNKKEGDESHSVHSGNMTAKESTYTTGFNTRESAAIDKLMHILETLHSKDNLVDLFDEVLSKVGPLLESRLVSVFVLHDDLQKYYLNNEKLEIQPTKSYIGKHI